MTTSRNCQSPVAFVVAPVAQRENRLIRESVACSFICLWILKTDFSDIHTYIGKLIDRKVDNPGNDIISDLVVKQVRTVLCKHA